MSTRARRTGGGSEPTHPRQQDLFAGLPEAPKPIPPATFASADDPPKARAPKALPPPRMKLARSRAPQAPKSSGRARSPAAPVRPAPPTFGADDWWTTRAVCRFLGIGRKALWNMRRDPACDFPAPVDAVGHRHLYLATDVRAWMEAQRELAHRRAGERRQAMTQFSARSS